MLDLLCLSFFPGTPGIGTCCIGSQEPASNIRIGSIEYLPQIRLRHRRRAASPNRCVFRTTDRVSACVCVGVRGRHVGPVGSDCEALGHGWMRYPRWLYLERKFYITVRSVEFHPSSTVSLPSQRLRKSSEQKWRLKKEEVCKRSRIKITQ